MENGGAGCTYPSVFARMCGLYFVLHSGQEHRNLQLRQLLLVEPRGGVPYIEYTENVSKNHPGGLKHRKIEPKKVKHLPNYQRPERCFVRLFKAYCAHRLPKVEHDSFYLTPLRNPRSIVWYQVTPVGHHTLANTVKWMCSSAGVDGYKTNHSLRVTTATRFAMKCSFVALCLWVFFITPCLFPAYYCDPAVRTTTGEAPDTIRFTPAKLRLTVVCLAATYK